MLSKTELQAQVYREMHEIATNRLGYECIMTAFEDLERLKAREEGRQSSGDRARKLVDDIRFQLDSLICAQDEHHGVYPDPGSFDAMLDELDALLSPQAAPVEQKPVFSHCPACAKDDTGTGDWDAGVGCSADGPTDGCEAVWIAPGQPAQRKET